MRLRLKKKNTKVSKILSEHRNRNTGADIPKIRSLKKYVCEATTRGEDARAQTAQAATYLELVPSRGGEVEVRIS